MTPIFRSRRRFVQASAISLAGLGAGLSSVPARAATMRSLTDVLGRTVQVPVEPRRVLLGFYFEDFYAIVGDAAFDRVVAISRDTWQGWRPSQWDAYTAVTPGLKSLVDVGEVEGGTFSLELALSATPDVALLAEWQYGALAEQVARLEAAGIPVVVVDYNAQTVDRHLDSTRVIGALMGVEERADALAAEYAAAVADVEARVARSPRPQRSVYVELGNRGPGTVGNSYGTGMWGGVIELAGGRNIASGVVDRWGPLAPEYVLGQNPDVILIPGSSWRGNSEAVLMGFGIDPQITRDRLRPYTARPGWPDLAAVQAGEVHAVYHGGARTLYDYTFLQYLAKVLHPEAFADLDPLETHRRYYERWLPIRADGSFMVRLEA